MTKLIFLKNQNIISLKFKYYLLLIFILFFLSCSKSKFKPTQISPIYYGKWAFICKNNFHDKYAEVDFINKNELNIRTQVSSSGYYNYQFKGDFLIIGSKNYQLVSGSNTKFELLNKKNKYVCYKISINDIFFNKDQIDPFYLRRAFFLVKEGFMSKDEAYNYIYNNRWVAVDSIIEK